jgi:CRISPR-associated protein Cas1
MKTVLIDSKVERLSYDNRTLKVDSRRVPLGLVDTIVNFSDARFDVKDMIKIVHEGVNIIHVDSRNRAAVVHGAYAKNSELKVLQYEAFTGNRLFVAKWVLSEKISAYGKRRIAFDEKFEENELVRLLQDIDRAETIATLMGIEGAFSRAYFNAYFASAPKLWHRGKRSKRPPQDPLNALLSFAYMQMYHYISVRLVAAGFEPGIGFLHTPFREHNALASDILEFFRADIDALVLRLVREETISLKDFSKNKGVYLRYEGRKKLWEPWREALAVYESQLSKIFSRLKEKIDGEKTDGDQE